MARFRRTMWGNCFIESDNFHSTKAGCKDLAAGGLTWFTFRKINFPDVQQHRKTSAAMPSSQVLIDAPKSVFSYVPAALSGGFPFPNGLVRDDYWEITQSTSGNGDYRIVAGRVAFLPVALPNSNGGNKTLIQEQLQLSIPHSLCSRMARDKINGIENWRTPTVAEIQVISAHRAAQEHLIGPEVVGAMKAGAYNLGVDYGIGSGTTRSLV